MINRLENRRRDLSYSCEIKIIFMFLFFDF